MPPSSDAAPYILAIVMVIVVFFAVLSRHFVWLAIIGAVGSFGNAIYGFGTLRGWWR